MLCHDFSSFWNVSFQNDSRFQFQIWSIWQTLLSSQLFIALPGFVCVFWKKEYVLEGDRRKVTFYKVLFQPTLGYSRQLRIQTLKRSCFFIMRGAKVTGFNSTRGTTPFRVREAKQRKGILMNGTWAPSCYSGRPLLFNLCPPGCPAVLMHVIMGERWRRANLASSRVV